MGDAYKHIKFEKRKSTGIITLDRPDHNNSVIHPMARDLQHALQYTADNNEIRSVLLTGKGSMFCVGQDLKEAMQKTEKNHSLEDLVREYYNPIIKSIRYLEKPVVCAVNGPAAGAGANIALACDILLMNKEAYFLEAFSKIGLIPDSGGTFTLPRIVGLHRATRIMMLDDRIEAEEAKQLGLVYKLCNPDDLAEESFQLSHKLSQKPTRALGLLKRALNQSFQNNLNQQLNLEADLQAEAGKTDDFAEGVRAFMEKRKPDFKGK